eukprot:4781057-Pleurochrysis_carterae.AAC.1
MGLACRVCPRLDCSHHRGKRMAWGLQRRTPVRRRQTDRARAHRRAHKRKTCRHASAKRCRMNSRLQSKEERRPTQLCLQPTLALARLAPRVLSP